MVVNLTAAKFESVTLSVCGLACTHVGNICIFVVPFGICLLPAYPCGKIIYVQNIGSHMQFMGRCIPWKATTLFCRSLVMGHLL
jgi:hypothetical protein